MDYSLLTRLAKWAVLLFTGGIAGTVVFRLLTGGINMNGIFWGRRNDGSMYLSAERVQGLLSTLAIAMLYLLNAAHATNGKMPELPAGALEILGLSNAVYLGGKGWMMLRKSK
jgi:hypothetical protein